MSVDLLERLIEGKGANSVRDFLRAQRKASGTSATSPPKLSRRGFLKGGTAALAAMQALATATEQAQARELRRPGIKKRPSKAPVTGQGNLDPTLLKLIDRGTFGFTRNAFAEAETMGFTNWVEWQLDHEAIDDSALDARLAVYDALTSTSQELAETYELGSAAPAIQLMEAAILRAVYSRRQLYERVVEFWSDHLNIYGLDDVPLLKLADDRDVIRQHAFGKFPDMLHASARSGAMLVYLDNYTNTKGNAQENYARELMELHTMGVDGGYTQQDVQEVARCLTGWTLILRTDSPLGEFGDFRFNANQHDHDPKVVLGQVIDNPIPNGIEDGNQVLDMVAMHPSTARFIAHKLCKRFIGYDPPEDIVTMVRDTYLATGGDVKEMLRVIFHPTVMTYLATPKIKRPFHLAASLLRATDAEIADPSTALNYLLVMGQAPYFWIPPDGYPDSLNAWSKSLLPRWQFATALLDGFVFGSVVDATALLNSEGGNAPGEQANAIDRILTGGRLTASELALIQDFFDNGVPPNYPLANRETIGLAASMPTFQWY